MPVIKDLSEKVPVEISLSKSPLMFLELRFIVQCFEYLVGEGKFKDDLLSDNQLQKAIDALHYVIYRPFQEEENDAESEYSDSELSIFRTMCDRYFESIKGYMQDSNEQFSRTLENIKKRNKSGEWNNKEKLIEVVESVWVSFFITLSLRTLDSIAIKEDRDENIFEVRVEKNDDFWEFTFPITPNFDTDPVLPTKMISNGEVITKYMASKDNDFSTIPFLAMLCSNILMNLVQRGEIGGSSDISLASLEPATKTIQ